MNSENLSDIVFTLCGIIFLLGIAYWQFGPAWCKKCKKVVARNTKVCPHCLERFER